MMATSLHQGTVIRVVDSAGEPIRKKGNIDFFAMGGDINCTNDLLQTPLHIGKKHALKIYHHFALNTSFFWRSAGSNIISVVQFYEIFVTKIMNKLIYYYY